MGTIKEMFEDRTIDGEPIPPHLVFIGALKKFDHSYAAVCRTPPPSLNDLVLDFGSLSADQESVFIANLINMRYFFYFPPKCSLCVNFVGTTINQGK
jgi:hypothetical protein